MPCLIRAGTFAESTILSACSWPGIEYCTPFIASHHSHDSIPTGIILERRPELPDILLTVLSDALSGPAQDLYASLAASHRDDCSRYVLSTGPEGDAGHRIDSPFTAWAALWVQPLLRALRRAKTARVVQYVALFSPCSGADSLFPEILSRMFACAWSVWMRAWRTSW